MTITGESGPYLLHGMRTMGFLRSFPFLPYTLIPTSFCKIKGIYPHNVKDYRTNLHKYLILLDEF
jgi:hypothetical protein